MRKAELRDLLLDGLDPALDCGLILWGDWWNGAALATLLKQQDVDAPWRAFPRGPGGALVVDNPFNAAALYLRAFPQTPYGDCAGLWINRYDTNNPFSLACTRWGAGWQTLADIDLERMAKSHPDGQDLISAYGQTPFVVGDTAHARMADMASFQTAGHAEQETYSTP